MKILIKDNIYAAGTGGTMAERKSSVAFVWATIVASYANKWMEVNTENLFITSFNGVHEGGLVNIPNSIVSAIVLAPEFKSVDAFIEKMQKQHDTKWPGAVDCELQYMCWASNCTFLTKLEWQEYEAYKLFMDVTGKRELTVTLLNYRKEPVFKRSKVTHETSGETIYFSDGKQYVLRTAKHECIGDLDEEPIYFSFMQVNHYKPAVEKVSNCCGATIIDDTDLCKDCGEHCEPVYPSECVIDSSRGIYAPQEFAKRYMPFANGELKDSFDICASGPDHTEYWEAWEDLLNAFRYNDGKNVYHFYQDDDVFMQKIDE